MTQAINCLECGTSLETREYRGDEELCTECFEQVAAEYMTEDEETTNIISMPVLDIELTANLRAQLWAMMQQITCVEIDRMTVEVSNAAQEALTAMYKLDGKLQALVVATTK